MPCCRLPEARHRDADSEEASALKWKQCFQSASEIARSPPDVDSASVVQFVAPGLVLRANTLVLGATHETARARGGQPRRPWFPVRHAQRLARRGGEPCTAIQSGRPGSSRTDPPGR